MSGNQKHTAGGGPQNQRFTGGAIYQPITLSQQQRTDGFHVATPPFAPQQQQQQPGNQGQTLRGIQPTGPPNQSSTPPTDLKVGQVPQQSMNHLFVGPQQQVRPGQPYYRSTPGPPSQNPRMPNQHRAQQQIYPTQPPFVHIPQMYLTAANTMQYFNGQRPQFVQPTPVVYQGQAIQSQYTFQSNPNQSPSLTFPFYQQIRQGPPQSAAVPQNAAQPLPQMPIPQPAVQPPPFQRQQHRRRTNAIPIIDPDTGLDRLTEMYDQQNSHPPSGESSARQTPQPAVQNSNKEVQATFAKQVAQAINNERSIEQEQHVVQSAPVEPETIYHQPPPQLQPQQQQASNRLDHIVQSSALKAHAKEFVLNPANTAKEPPVVSAMCDSVEVTLPNKQHIKDRESPAKGRKQQQQQREQPPAAHTREHKDSINKDTPPPSQIRENINDKETSPSSSINASKIENKPKEGLLPTATLTQQQQASVLPVNVVTSSKDNNKEVVTHHRDDKTKNQKKDVSKSADAVKVVPQNVEASDSNAVPISAQPAQDVASSNAKSKNASQRAAKEAQKQQQQQQQQQQVASSGGVGGGKQNANVPPPQPPKTNNKTSKKSDLNLKGANKEGTDMDAFNDSNRLADAVNANINLNNEINANSVVVNNTNTPPPQQTNATPVPVQQQQQQINTTNEKKQSVGNEGAATVVKNENKTQTNKIDVTAIVREQPKAIKSYPTSNVESQDETDRALMTNDKLVQAKNEANTKACTENNNAKLIDSKTALPYKEDQWAPDNLDGKKVYDKDFLLALRFKPVCKQRPDNIPEVIIADERGRLSDGRYSMGGRTDFTTPPFTNYGGKSSSQRGPPPKRNSQSGKVGGGKGSKSQVIKVSISVREDVKLHEAENAWKPARLHKSEVMTDDDHKTEDLYKKVRGVLNKLTPQKFDTLISQVRSLEIDTADRLQGVIDLVFEKAVDEPNFSVAYALMCRELALMQVPAANSTAEKLEVVNFRKLLITRCQLEFEKQSVDESIRNDKIKEIEECTDLEKKKELEFELEDYDRKLRMKSVGNIRFIGELFKQSMLTINIMMRCLNNLLENKDEESLECLCKLLTTIGKELETKKIGLDPIFTVMKEIVEKRHGRVSSRVRFMLQDVIDLRRSKWIPRRQDSNPKTIEQIQEEAKNEQLNIQAMNSVPITPRKDERGGGGGGGGGGGSGSGSNAERNKRRNVSDDGWQTASRNNRQPFTVHSDKLKNKPPLTDEPLGSRSMFGNWSKGSNIKTDPTATTNTANMYAALENIDAEKRPQGGSGALRANSKDPYSSKGPSLERGNYKQYDGRGSRSGSQHRSMERERESPVPSSQKKAVPAAAIAAVVSTPAAPAKEYKLTEDELERHVKNNLEEYLNDSCTVEEYAQDTLEFVPPAYFPRLVADGYLGVLERSQKTRLRTGQLFGKLILLGVLPIDDYCSGLEEVLSQADDLTIDIPMIWNYLGEILVHLVCENALPLSRLHKSCDLLIGQNHGAKLLAPLFKLVVSEQGPNFLTNIWQISGLTLEDFMEKSQVDSFIKDNKFEFLVGGATTAGQTQLTFDQIHVKLIEFFNLKTSFDDICNWITANVGERVNDNRFIRTLATSIFENSIHRQKLVIDNLHGHYKLLLKYVDTNPTYELQCLYALQALFHKMEHPQGVLLSVCDRLYDDSIVSQDSFITWEMCKDPAEQEGKGVALKQLTSFFTQLKENEDDESTSSDEA